MRKKAVIFDLDGVIVTTDEYHYLAWKQLADEEGIYFSREINEALRGVSRMECLEIILKKSAKLYTNSEKNELSERKNNYYRKSLNNLTQKDILPGVLDLLKSLKEMRIKIAIGSSSKNSSFILERIGLDTYFDAIADGNKITKSKPDPEVFLLASKMLGVMPDECVVVEDAQAGIEAALAAGMKAVAVGAAATDERAHIRVASLTNITIDELIAD